MHFKREKDYFKDTLKDYLSFSTQERRSFFAVIIILLLLIVIKLAIEYWPASNSQTDFSKFDKEINDFLASNKSASASSVSHVQILPTPERKNYPKKNIPALFNFNPNGLPEEDWKRLGFSEKQIHVIKNYEAKGGKFFSKEDVKKVYSISTSDYARIEPYITIPSGEKTEHKNAYENKFPVKVVSADFKIDIGIADTTELKKLRGIGSSFANRIVKYRLKLGGFYSINQLHEVWGMNDSLFNIIADHVYIADTGNINRININAVTFNELKLHPYFNYNLAHTLINYRIQHGAFKLLADLRRMPLVDDSIYRKIAPYLKVE